MYPELRRIWYPAMGLGMVLLATGMLGVLAAVAHHPGYPFCLRARRHSLAVAFLTFGILSELYSAGTIVGSAVFFPEVLDDRTDHLHGLKATNMAAFVMSFGWAGVATVLSLRLVYAEFLDEFFDGNGGVVIDMAPLVVRTASSASACMNLELNERTVESGGGESVLLGGLASGAVPDVRTYMCRGGDECDEESEDELEGMLLPPLPSREPVAMTA